MALTTFSGVPDPGEDGDDRVVHRVADGAAEGRIQPELHVGRPARGRQDRLQGRVRDAGLRSLGDGQTGAGLGVALLHLGAHDVLEELDALRRGVLGAGEPVPAAQGRLRVTRRAGDRRNREPAEELGESRLVRGDGLQGALVPVAHELHRGLAVGEKAVRAGRVVLARCGDEVGLERLGGDEGLEILAGLHEARIVEDQVDRRLSSTCRRSRHAARSCTTSARPATCRRLPRRSG